MWQNGQINRTNNNTFIHMYSTIFSDTLLPKIETEKWHAYRVHKHACFLITNNISLYMLTRLNYKHIFGWVSSATALSVLHWFVDECLNTGYKLRWSCNKKLKFIANAVWSCTNQAHETFTIYENIKAPLLLNCLGSGTRIIYDFHNTTMEAHANKCETAI